MTLDKNVYIYVHSSLYASYGVKVIVDNVKMHIKNVSVCNELSSIPSGAVVIPYGILESFEVIRSNRFYCGLSLMVDAYSLGEWSNFKKYWNKRYISFEYRIKCLLRAIKYLVLEYYILSRYNKIMLVSWGDIDYYARMPILKKYVDKIVVIQNGVVLPIPITHNTINKKTIRIGCLSPWGGTSYYSLQLFLKEIWSKIPQNQSCELIIAGRDINPEKKAFMESFRNVKVIGEVKYLNDFYSLIDISLVTMVKKCGIINRVLDGFSYNVPVLCRPESLLAFKNLPDCCYTYHDTGSFTEAVNLIINNQNEAYSKANEAFNYVKEYNNWVINYRNINKIISTCYSDL